MFSCEFCEISKNTFFTEHVWVTAFENVIVDKEARRRFISILLLWKSVDYPPENKSKEISKNNQI